jgi:hypothetical protein
MSRADNIVSLLSRRFNPSAVNLVVKEYTALKSFYHTEKWDKVIIHSAIMCEAVVGLIAENILKISIDYNKIDFNDIYKRLISTKKASPEDEILLLAVPQVAKSIYTIRNKKRVAHLKLIDPDYIDASYCSVAADWILSQLLTVAVGQVDEKAVTKLIRSLVEREVPLIEEFEDGTVKVLTSLSLADAILLVLYKRYPERITSHELVNTLRLEEKEKENISKVLYALDKRRGLIHRNKEGGATLTKKGIKYVEESILNKNKL